uniref:Uncharacterized protein n=1 Tax=Panagrolaimus superbus TaxID=310955 RepID=A0A914YV52_9BILA
MCTISHSDGTLVTFDRLFANIPQLKFFYMSCAQNSFSMFKRDTFKKLADILPLSKEYSCINLSRLTVGLDDLTEAFDFATVTDFLLKNESLFIFLGFDKNIPLSSGYKEIIENFIAKIIETPPKQIPLIEFPEFENSVYYDDYRKLYDLRK